jgi:branched-chain amino acid transport system permease protein
VARILVLGTILGLTGVAPLLMPAVSVNVLSTVAVFAVVALSLNILVGYTGQVSLGHSAFVGVGAFASGFAMTVLGLPWALGVAVAITVGAVAAIVIGFVALRVRGLYLALVTLVYAVFAERVLFNIEALTGGGAGMMAPRPPWAMGDVTYAYLCIGAVVVVWLLALPALWLLTRHEPSAGASLVAGVALSVATLVRLNSAIKA